MKEGQLKVLKILMSYNEFQPSKAKSYSGQDRYMAIRPQGGSLWGAIK